MVLLKLIVYGIKHVLRYDFEAFSSNDINLSLMCKGTRKSGRFDKGEISVAFPIHMFDSIVEGIISTVNPVHTPEDKTPYL